MPNKGLLFPRQGDKNTVYLKNLVKSEFIEIGDYSFYYDIENAQDFEKKCVLYHYPYVPHSRSLSLQVADSSVTSPCPKSIYTKYNYLVIRN